MLCFEQPSLSLFPPTMKARNRGWRATAAPRTPLLRRSVLASFALGQKCSFTVLFLIPRRVSPPQGRASQRWKQEQEQERCCWVKLWGCRAAGAQQRGQSVGCEGSDLLPVFALHCQEISAAVGSGTRVSVHESPCPGGCVMNMEF